MRTKTKATTVRRCPDCGVSVPAGPFQPDPPTESVWTRCADCATATPDGIRAAMLARIGVEHAADDPAVIAALRTVPWRAVVQETERATRAAESQVRIVHGETQQGRERRVAQALAGIDAVGQASSQPWSHVDARAVRRACAQARRAAATAALPRRCTDGPCGVCGTRLAQTWPMSVRIGTGTLLQPGPRRPWPVCSACAPVLSAAGGSATSDPARRRWTAIVLGTKADPPAMSVPPLVATYAEYVGIATDPREAEGCEVPWGFVSQADRDVIAQQAPQHRPAEVLDRERRVAAAQARLDRARRAEGPRTALASGSDR